MKYFLLFFVSIYFLSCSESVRKTSFTRSDTLLVIRESILAFDTLLGEKQILQPPILIKSKFLSDAPDFQIHGKNIILKSQSQVDLERKDYPIPRYLFEIVSFSILPDGRIELELLSGDSGKGCRFIWRRDKHGKLKPENAVDYKT